ncbi:polysaccharide deacetylase family protein [Achromobacter xylosoxidans]
MLCITFDNFGGAVGDLLPWPCPAGIPAAEWAAYNRIGLELGHPRILKLLDELRIRCTYFAEGYAAVLHPDELLAWHAVGHEIAVHGWKHEMWTGIASRDEEERLIQLAVSSIRGLTGQTPAGFRRRGWVSIPGPTRCWRRTASATCRGRCPARPMRRSRPASRQHRRRGWWCCPPIPR